VSLVADPTAAYPPLNDGLFRPHQREQFVVFAYWTPAGWWRREGDYPSEAAAQRVADAHNDQGRAVIVARQTVIFGPIEPLTGVSGLTLCGHTWTGVHSEPRSCRMIAGHGGSHVDLTPCPHCQRRLWASAPRPESGAS
jgi:hypothetical protein